MATTTQNGVVYANLGLKGSALAATSFTTAVASATTSLRDYANGLVSATQAAETDSAFATQVMTNLGLTAAVIGQAAYDALQPALAAYVNSVGVANRGVVVVQLSQIVAGLTGDATFGAAAVNLNTAAASAYTYSTTAANTTDGAITVIPTAKSFALTTSTDTFEGTTASDTVTATSATIAAADTIYDAYSTDNDVLNVTLTAANKQFTVTGIETINVDFNQITAGSFDATNVSKAKTINLSSSKFGFVGDATVTGNAVTGETANVTAGTGITGALTVTDAHGITVDVGSAATLIVDPLTAGTSTLTVNVNGDLNLGLGAAFKSVTLNTTKDAKVDLDTTAGGTSVAATALAITGAASTVTLRNAEILTTKTITDSLTSATGVTNAYVEAAGAVDASKWGVDKITLAAAIGANNVTVKSGVSIDVAASQAVAGLQLVGDTLTKTTNSVTVNSASKALGGLTTTDLATVNLALSGTVDTGAINTGGTTSTVVLTGSGTATVGTLTAKKLDASAFTGDLSYTAGSDSTIVAGAGTNTLTAGATNLNDFTGGAGVDTVDGTALTTGTLVFSGGAGNDVVKLGAAINTKNGSIIVDGGDGTDTVQITADTTNLSTATVTLVNVEKVLYKDGIVGAQANGATLNGSVISGKTITLATDDSLDTTTFTIAANKATLDLTNVTRTGVSIAVTGKAATDQTITGTAGNDTITAGTSATAAGKTLTGNGGADTYVFVANDSTSSAMTKITDFVVTASSTSADKLDLEGTAVVAATLAATDVTGLNKTNDAAITAALAGATGTVNVAVSNGFISLTGLSADVAKIDTLAEWLLIAADVLENGLATAKNETVAFVFGGNTYVVDEDGTTNGLVDNVIQLVGTPGTKLGTVAADATILIA